MTVFSLIAFAVSLTCIVMGIIILFRDRASRNHRLFFMICLTLSLLNMVSIPAYSAPDKAGVMFWTELAAWCVNPFYAVNLHFYIDLIFKRKIKIRGIILLYLPSVLINLQFLLHPYSILDYVKFEGQWKLIPAYGNLWFYIASGYVLIYASITVIIILMYLNMAVYNKERKQAVWLMMNLIISTSIGIAGLWVIPFFDFRVPNIGPTYHLFYVAGLFYSVYRFRLMDINPSIVADEIISHINDLVILLSRELKVVSVNTAGQLSLGFSIDYLKGKYFPDLVYEKDLINNILQGIASGGASCSGIMTRFKTEYEPVITDSYIAAVKDKFNDIIGFLIISREKRGRKEFRKAYKITERELEIVDLTITGFSSREIGKQLGISDRTVQSHQEHIYQKLGATGKVDLIRRVALFNLTEKKL